MNIPPGFTFRGVPAEQALRLHVISIESSSGGEFYAFDSDSCLPENHWTVVGQTVNEDGSVTCELAWVEPEPGDVREPLVTVVFR